MPDLRATARTLGVSPATVRRWLRAGAPQARAGRRGRGGHADLDPAAIAAWRGQPQASSVRAFAGDVPELVAGAVWQTFTAIDGPHKRRCAGELAAVWYAVAVALLDRLRADDPSIPELRAVPRQIDHLRAICRDFGRL